MTPKVTFIMAVARDKFLEEAIGSILGQTMPDWELLLFDNKDCYHTKKLDSRIHLYSTSDWSPAKCYNFGMKCAKSNNILIATDDDVNFSERTLITYDYLSHGIDYISGSCFNIDEKGYVKGYVRVKPFRLEYQKYVANTISLPFAGFKKDKVPEFNEDFKICYDYLFNLQCGMRELNIKTTFIPLGLKRIWKDSLYMSQPRGLYMEEVKRIRTMYNDPTIRSQKDHRDTVDRFMRE